MHRADGLGEYCDRLIDRCGSAIGVALGELDHAAHHEVAGGERIARPRGLAGDREGALGGSLGGRERIEVVQALGVERLESRGIGIAGTGDHGIGE